MTGQQVFIFSVLGVTLGLFIWNRWRYDVVALLALMTVTVAGLVSPADAFLGFGHPAVITVAAVLVLSQGLLNAGVVDVLARIVSRVGSRPTVQLAALAAMVGVCSAFMNNVGALALFMPVAIALARRSGASPSMMLMPLAFASLLGGMTTLVGTPPNIIIATYREQASGDPFGMFSFAPVGGAVTLLGVLFIGLVGWRFMPQRHRPTPASDLFRISDYVAEVRVREGSPFVGRPLYELAAAAQAEGADVVFLELFHGRDADEVPPMHSVLHVGDELLVEADSESLKTLVSVGHVDLINGAAGTESAHSAAELSLTEAIVTPDSPLVGETVVTLDLRRRYGVNVLAVARHGGQVRDRIATIEFAPGDIILVQAGGGQAGAACGEWRCLPLADRGLRFSPPRGVPLAVTLFAASLALAATNVLPAATALVSGALAMVILGIVSPSQATRSIDLPIIVLLGAMIPVGQAMETTGGAQLIADGLSRVAASTSIPWMVALLMGATLLLSNVVNNAAAAILVAPIGIDLSKAIGCSADPFLMAVAVGASAAFLTPIGHQSNTLVMEPGGYRFGDYWRLGLPLSLLVMAVAVPLILWVWPPFP